MTFIINSPRRTAALRTMAALLTGAAAMSACGGRDGASGPNSATGATAEKTERGASVPSQDTSPTPALMANSSVMKTLGLGGTRLTPSQVAAYLRGAGFPESAVGRMVCIAKYESSYYTGAYNYNTNGTTDYGLFQINGYYWASACGTTGQGLLDPNVNARCALKVWREQGYFAWYGYRYNQWECDSTPAPGSARAVKITRTPNKLYTGLSRAYAFCSNLPVGTAVQVIGTHGDMYDVTVPSGVCKDWQGRIQTRGFILRSVTQ